MNKYVRIMDKIYCEWKSSIKYYDSIENAIDILINRIFYEEIDILCNVANDQNLLLCCSKIYKK